MKRLITPERLLGFLFFIALIALTLGVADIFTDWPESASGGFGIRTYTYFKAARIVCGYHLGHYLHAGLLFLLATLALSYAFRKDRA